MTHVLPQIGRGLMLTSILALSFAQALAQDEASAQDRDSAEIPETKEYVELPNLTVTEKRWRLSEEEKQKLIQEELERTNRMIMEEEERESRNRALVSRSGRGKKGRMKTDIFPYYNPEKNMNVGVEGPPVEVVEFFRLSW